MRTSQFYVSRTLYVTVLALTALSSPLSRAIEEVPAPAAPEVSTTAAPDVSNRMKNRLGAYLAFREPAPTIIGLNLAYNPFDFLRVSAGYGKLTVTSSISCYNNNCTTTEASATTLGFGARAFVPGWSFSPSVGLHYGHVSYDGEGLEVGGFTESGGHIYTTLGVDWQAKGGFNGSLGYQRSLKGDVGGAVYLSAGWFFGFAG